MLIHGTSFNEKWAKSIDEQTFVDTLMPVAIWQDFPDKEEKLRKAWKLMNGKTEEEAPKEEIPVPEKKTPRNRREVEIKKGAE